MKVLFVSDFRLSQNNGGAQVSNHILIQRGKELGIDIVEHNYDSSLVNFIRPNDLIISSNLECISYHTPNVLELILSNSNHIRLEHDSCNYLSDNLRQRLFTHAKKTIFLSEFHAQFFKEKYGNYFHDVEIIYDPIDVNIFKPENAYQKIYDVVYCGLLHDLKGRQNLRQFAAEHSERRVDAFGWVEPGTDMTQLQKLRNFRFHGSLQHSDIPKIFQQSQAVFHTPIVNEPFCRMVAEALLCGVTEVIGATEKIGSALEFEKVGSAEFAKRCAEAPDKFWEVVAS